MQARKNDRAAVTICSTAFQTLGHAQARALGEPELPLLIIPHPFGTCTRDQIEALAQTCAAQLADLATIDDTTSSPGIAATRSPSAHTGRIEVADELDAVQRLFREKRWGDGLPVIAPTIERVRAMIAGHGLSAQTLVAKVAPGYGAATIESIAINAVAAGCDPELLPLVVAAVQATADERFNLQGIQATTNPVAVWLIINGPGAKQLGFHAGINCLGQGAWSNLTLGRAVHLVLQNIGGARPGEMDRATHGQPGKIAFCCAENEGSNPWSPLHVERGFRADATTVTVVGAEGTMNMNTHAKKPDQLLQVFAETMIHPPSNEYTHGGEPWLILSPEHADILYGAGMSKPDVKRQLWERSKMAAKHLSDGELQRALASRREEFGGDITPETLLTISRSPDDIGIIVAGGPGTHSVYVPCFGNSRAITVEVQRT